MLYASKHNRISHTAESVSVFVRHLYIHKKTWQRWITILLFEHGGNPNLIYNGPSIFSEIDFDVLFDAGEQQDRQRYSSLVRCWMVYLAYGATDPDGSLPVTVFHDFDIRKLKDHRQFYFGITKGDPWPDIHIFSKKDMWEAVRA